MVLPLTVVSNRTNGIGVCYMKCSLFANHLATGLNRIQYDGLSQNARNLKCFSKDIAALFCTTSKSNSNITLAMNNFTTDTAIVPPGQPLTP